MARGKVRATANFAAEVDSEEVIVHVGDEFPATSKVVKGREDLFESQLPEPPKK
jgi:hypothetical protein